MRMQVGVWVVGFVALVAVTAGLLRAPSAHEPPGWELVVLGIAQDAGIPHLGCEQGLCWSIRSGGRKPERVASIGLVNRTLQRSYLIDATPDIVSQIHDLTGGTPPDGILLTHAHIGHYAGLDVPRPRVDRRERGSGVRHRPDARLSPDQRALEPARLAQEHRSPSVADRPAFRPRSRSPRHRLHGSASRRVHRYRRIPHRGPRKKVLYIPDIDQWQKWERPIRELVDQVDLAFLDGTFASASEIPGRSIDDIPHPMMSVTREVLRGTKAAVWFIHLNHTNAEIDAEDVVKDRQRFRLY